MKPYSVYSSCPKCGEGRGGIKTEYVSTDPSYAKEHMLRRCVMCGYSWREACKDQPPLPGDSEVPR